MRFGLDRMRRLMTALDSPDRRFRSIQVLGTNGKSSTARMTAALLGAHGLRSGAYLSPHLQSFAERIEIAGRPVSDEELAAAVGRAARAAALAVAAAEAFLARSGRGGLDPAAVRAAAAGMRLPGRLEVVDHDPLVVLDGAHNPDGARALRDSLGEAVGDRRPVAVISIMEDK